MMTPKQAKTLAVLLHNVKPHHLLPTADDVIDGCFAAGLGANCSTAAGVAEMMNLWRILPSPSTTQSAGKLLNALVEMGYAARVFIAGEPSPRYTPTKAGFDEHTRRTPTTENMTILELIQQKGARHYTQRDLSRERQIAIWLLVRTQGMSMAAVGRAAGVSAGRIKQIVQRRDWAIDWAIRGNDRRLPRRRA